MQENEKIEQAEVLSPESQTQPQAIEQTQNCENNFDNGKASASYGKFDSAESLYEGYQQLEREFTKKCQVLKELENRAGDSQQILQKMLKVNPQLGQFAEELKPANGVGELSVLLAEKLVGKINEPCTIINDEEFLNNFVYSNEAIVSKIVADYLDSLVSMKIPQTIAKGGNAYVSPTYRPRTLDEAGKMAKKFIENRRF